jgi:N-acyl-D-aspartate/D-glutamate deacylase
MKCILVLLILSVVVCPAAQQKAENFDLVILGGRVIDPETKIDAVRNIGIRGGKIAAITSDAITAAHTIDAHGLVVAPGFIDLHQHGQDDENYRLKAMDGVTTALELEVDVADIDSWYQEREGKALINYGASIGHIPIRMSVMHDPGTLLPVGPAAHQAATPEQVNAIVQQLQHGLDRGALAVGLGPAYTEAATADEILQVFEVAAKNKASCHVHLRAAADRIRGLQEVLADAAVSGAPLHVVHIQSTGEKDTGRELQMIAEARAHGMDVTTEMYPYIAGMTRIESAVLDTYENNPNADFHTLMWPATGERLTRESFERYRKQGGAVILFSNTEDVVDNAALNPLTMIASDGSIGKGKGHPRTAGTYARILGHYVRETRQMELMTAIAKMTLMPAQRLERRAPAFANKGRIRVGADADVAIFDPERIQDRATYQQPATPSEGMRYVLVNGVEVVHAGVLVTGSYPGKGLRAPLQ